jgi:hypothetical protein
LGSRLNVEIDSEKRKRTRVKDPSLSFRLRISEMFHGPDFSWKFQPYPTLDNY